MHSFANLTKSTLCLAHTVLGKTPRTRLITTVHAHRSSVGRSWCVGVLIPFEAYFNTLQHTEQYATLTVAIV